MAPAMELPPGVEHQTEDGRQHVQKEATIGGHRIVVFPPNDLSSGSPPGGLREEEGEGAV